MIVCRLFGIRIRLNPFFLLLLFFLGIFDLLIEALILFATVFLHECAHAYVARKSGLIVTEIELLPFGGVAKIDDFVELNPTTEMRVAIAGPIANAVVVAGLMSLAGTAIFAHHTTELLLKANVWIGSFNLLPALPLDGGRVLRAVLVGKMGFRRATEVAARIGKVIAVMMAVGGVVLLYVGLVNASLIVVAAFVFMAAKKEESVATYVLLAHLARKQFDWRGSRCLSINHLAAKEGAVLKEVIAHIVPARFHIVWIIDERGHVTRVVAEGELIEAVFERGTDTPMGELGRPI